MFYLEYLKWLNQLERQKHEREDWLFACQRCHSKFPDPKSLHNHLQRRIFECPFVKCKQTFVHKDEALIHSKRCQHRLTSSAFDCFKIYPMM